MAKLRKPADVRTMDPEHVVLGKGNRDSLVHGPSVEDRVIYGDQLRQEDDEFRARFYFQPEVAAKLRAATRKALGRRGRNG